MSAGLFLLVGPELKPSNPKYRTPKITEDKEKDKKEKRSFWSKKHRRTSSKDLARPETAVTIQSIENSVSDRPVSRNSERFQQVAELPGITIPVENKTNLRLEDFSHSIPRSIPVELQASQINDLSSSFEFHPPVPKERDVQLRSRRPVTSVSSAGSLQPPSIPTRVRPPPLNPNNRISQGSQASTSSAEDVTRTGGTASAVTGIYENQALERSRRELSKAINKDYSNINEDNYNDLMLLIDMETHPRAGKLGKLTTRNTFGEGHNSVSLLDTEVRSPDATKMVHDPSFNIRSYLEGEDLSGDWWRHCEPPEELNYIADPENTPADLLSLLNEERLEEDIEKIRNPPLKINPKPASAQAQRLARESYLGDAMGSPSSYAGSAGMRNSSAMSTTTAASSAPDFSSPIALQALSRWSSSSTETSNNVSGLEKRKSTRKAYGSLSKSLTTTSRPRSELRKDSSFMKKWSSGRKGTAECSSCMDEVKDAKIVPLECQHKYCQSCFSRQISVAIQNEETFPPKCCGTEIPKKTIIAILPQDEKIAYRRKEQEYSLSIEERIYCPSKTCGIFVPSHCVPKSKDASAQCPTCTTRICQHCHDFAHGSTECSKPIEKGQETPAVKLVLDTTFAPPEHEAMPNPISTHPTNKLPQRGSTFSDASHNSGPDHARLSYLNDKYHYLHTILCSIIDSQDVLLSERLKTIRAALTATQTTAEQKHHHDILNISASLDTRTAERAASLTSNLTTQITKLADQHEEEEDEIIMTMTKRLRGKANREERIDGALQKLKASQTLEVEDLRAKYSTDLASVKETVSTEITALIQELQKKRDAEKQAEVAEWRDVARQEVADELWFEAIRELRMERLRRRLEEEKKGKHVNGDGEIEEEEEENDMGMSDDDGFLLERMLEAEHEQDMIAERNGRGKERRFLRERMGELGLA